MINDPWTQTIEAQQPSASAIEKIKQDNLLMRWQKAKEQLSFWKDAEMELRKECAAFLVPAKTEGTTNVELGAGYKVKVVNKYNYKLASDNDIVWAVLDKIGKIGNQGKFIAERLVSWTPNFLKTEYTTLQEEANKGSEDAKQILAIVNNEMLTITEDAPTLEIVEPKVSKKK